MRVSVIRPALVYGPNAKGNLELMWNAIKNKHFLPIPNVKNRRSMIHVDDLVDAIILISQNLIINREIFNATDGFLYSTREIYETMCDLQNMPASKWSVPKSVLEITAFIYPSLRLKVKKLIADECYSSEKLNSFGFKAQRTLREMNETFF
jgi:nucleoside-diphosphate-sugar epimerase